MTEWTLSGVFDEVAAAVPDRTLTICGERRRSFGETALRTRKFANFLAERGFGEQTPRAELERWECGQDRIALVMRNDQYLDVMIGSPDLDVTGVRRGGERVPLIAAGEWAI